MASGRRDVGGSTGSANTDAPGATEPIDEVHWSPLPVLGL